MIAGNHVHENGPSAVDPVCGAFVGYANDLEIADNVLSANGGVGDDLDSRRPGLRGGIYAPVCRRAHDDLRAIDAEEAGAPRARQPCGPGCWTRADRVCVRPGLGRERHFNSEHTRRVGFLDSAVGGVLIVNFAGIHRVIARLFRALVGDEWQFAAFAELSLLGRNAVRRQCGAARPGQPIVDVAAPAVHGRPGLRGEHVVGLRRAPFLAKVVFLAGTIGATASRFREDAAGIVSLLTVGG